MVGTTIVSMMKTESTRMVLLAAATGPCGSRRFIGDANRDWRAPKANVARMRSRDKCRRTAKVPKPGEQPCTGRCDNTNSAR
ncbi:hypothetical protein C2U70_32500 [Bradyrhizobium guangdongense]|nr:hypothetical protein C2U70_32500 [Bradyrhizobium guangdongense]